VGEKGQWGSPGVSEFDSARSLEHMGERAKKMCLEARFGWRKSKVLEKKMGFSFQFGERKRQSQRCWMCSSYELYSRV